MKLRNAFLLSVAVLLASPVAHAAQGEDAARASIFAPVQAAYDFYRAEATKVLAANQGLYNGFIAAGLFYAAITASREFAMFFLVCVVIAGLYGAWSVSRRIFYVQALPALIAIAMLWFTR